MASSHSNNNHNSSPVNNKTKFVVSDLEQQQLSRDPENEEEANKKEEFDYSKRSQWLRAAVLGANDGLVSTAALMMGVGAVREDMKAMVLSGFAGLVAGACSMAIGEFVSVYSQLDIEIAQMKRRQQQEDEKEKKGLPNPLQAAAASAFAFSVGAMVPLLAASFVRDYKLRLGLILGSVSFALILFGCLAATLGKAPPFRSCVRVFLGGWLAMAITFGLTKLIGSSVF
ncbi:hypothetical protein HN51_056344 [Arachis hypogaea]|uniref:Vacuolar iron transporter n=1 Tax=Arachis hypogaea TaxID=3818 RepID=A0A444XTK6_ARAHY|nr:vacuolar iron transporter homolog 1-like [Arachis ipaensis]XP_025674301.1 vacuolar iron transporter homolog 1-like [Arachis hypogaea]QHN79196.1 uncharacterized protein DS421_19g668000 [Arachis hypogaea]RYQ93107.1 hypothetical protein Ahy_B09g099371 [Arachis hypogaea]